MAKKRSQEVMPKVGKKTYPYTKAGMESAEKEAKKTGKKMIKAKKKKKSGKSGGY